MNCCRKYTPRIAEKPNPFYKLLKAVTPINITSELKETVDSVNKVFSDTCDLVLKELFPEEELVLMTDARFRSAGFALMIEDNLDRKIQSKRKTYATLAFGSKIFTPSQLEMAIYRKDFLAINTAFPNVSRISWKAKKLTKFLTDEKSVTCSFFDKNSSAENALDYVLRLNFEEAHIEGSVSTVAVYNSRLEPKRIEKIRLKNP